MVRKGGGEERKRCGNEDEFGDHEEAEEEDLSLELALAVYTSMPGSTFEEMKTGNRPHSCSKPNSTKTVKVRPEWLLSTFLELRATW